MKRRPDRAKLRASLVEQANATRDTADEMALMFDGCDDPLHPFMSFDPQPFRDWHDFVDRVCWPLVNATDEASVQTAMALYRKANPHFIAACLVFASNAAGRSESPKAGT